MDRAGCVKSQLFPKVLVGKSQAVSWCGYSLLCLGRHDLPTLASSLIRAVLYRDDGITAGYTVLWHKQGLSPWADWCFRKQIGEIPGKENYLLHIAACVGKDQRNHNESVSFFFFKGNFRRVIQLNSLLKICRWLVKCNQIPLTF